MKQGARSKRRATLDWLQAHGFEIHETKAITGTFIPHIRIHAGTLQIDADAAVSDILHEAGHLAILPGDIRPMATGDIEDAIAEIMDRVTAVIEPDTPFSRALVQASDPEATAWAWAAGTAIGLEPGEIIDDGDYEGQGASIRAALMANMYPGIHGLHHAGMTIRKEYPSMLRWLQPVFGVDLAQTAPGPG